MILSRNKFKENIVIKPNLNMSLIRNIGNNINYQKDIFEAFESNPSFDLFYNNLCSENVSEDTKRILTYCAYGNFSYNEIDNLSKLKKHKLSLQKHFDEKECILDKSFCICKLIEQKRKSESSKLAAKHHIVMINDSLERLKKDCKIKMYELSKNGASDINIDSTKKADGVIVMNNNAEIYLFASYISTMGGSQTDKLNVEDIASKDGIKCIRIMDGQGALDLFYNQQNKVEDNKNLFLTCANCIPEAIEYFN